MKKAKRFAALFLSGLLAVGSLAGCGRNYDPSDVEDPAGMGTADNLEAADAARMVSLYRTAQAGSGLPAGQDERVQDALNRAFNRHTSGDITTLCRVLQKTLRKAGGNPCPPTVVGMGIGGTFEKAAFLAKKALLRKTGEPNPDPRYAELEAEILEKINATGVGPQGLGGSVTTLAVHIEFFPCHIASLPVAINVNCHAARHAEVEL